MRQLCAQNAMLVHSAHPHLASVSRVSGDRGGGDRGPAVVLASGALLSPLSASISSAAYDPMREPVALPVPRARLCDESNRTGGRRTEQQNVEHTIISVVARERTKCSGCSLKLTPVCGIMHQMSISVSRFESAARYASCYVCSVGSVAASSSSSEATSSLSLR